MVSLFGTLLPLSDLEIPRAPKNLLCQSWGDTQQPLFRHLSGTSCRWGVKTQVKPGPRIGTPKENQSSVRPDQCLYKVPSAHERGPQRTAGNGPSRRQLVLQRCHVSGRKDTLLGLVPVLGMTLSLLSGFRSHGSTTSVSFCHKWLYQMS